ncbi:MAG: ABC transporter permease [Aeromicrobium sp.]
MIDALRYEVLRLRTIRSTFWLIGIALVFQLLISMLIAWLFPDSGPLSGGDDAFSILVTAGASLGVAPLFIAYVMGLLGVFSMGHEYRHGMIRATLTALPSRISVLAAKMVTIATASVVVAFVCSLLSLLSAAVFDVDPPSFIGWRDITLGIVLFTGLFALSGLAIATITRNQTVAVALVLLLPTVVESIIKTIVLAIKVSSDDPGSTGGVASFVRFLPYDAGGQMYTRISIGKMLEIFGIIPLGPVGGGLVMASFVAILLALGGWLFVRRDA